MREFFSVNVRDVGAKDEGGFIFTGDRLKDRGLADGELNGIGSGRDEGVDGAIEILDAREEALFIEEAVIDGDIEAAARAGMEEPVEAEFFHVGKERA